MEKGLDFFEKIPHESRIVFSAPTKSGKTWKVAALLQEKVIQPPPEQIILLYSQQQPAYSKMPQETIFIQGIPPDLGKYLSANVRTVLIIDDLQSEIESNKEITKLVCVQSHHLSTTVILLVQNFFLRGVEWRNISLNIDIIFLFASPRDINQIGYLGTQLGDRKRMLSAYKDATSQPYKYLLIDLRGTCPEEWRFRSNILKHEGYTVVYKRE